MSITWSVSGLERVVPLSVVISSSILRKLLTNYRCILPRETSTNYYIHFLDVIQVVSESTFWHIFVPVIWHSLTQLPRAVLQERDLFLDPRFHIVSCQELAVALILLQLLNRRLASVPQPGEFVLHEDVQQHRHVVVDWIAALECGTAVVRIRFSEAVAGDHADSFGSIVSTQSRVLSVSTLHEDTTTQIGAASLDNGAIASLDCRLSTFHRAGIAEHEHANDRNHIFVPCIDWYIVVLRLFNL